MDDNAAALTVGKWLTLVIFGDHFCLTFMSGMTTTYIWKLLELAQRYGGATTLVSGKLVWEDFLPIPTYVCK